MQKTVLPTEDTQSNPCSGSALPEGNPRDEEFVPISLEPDPVIEAYKKDIDRTLLIENLKLTPTERLRKLMEMVVLYRELQRAGEKLRTR